jgi:hypothetical protein
MNHSSRNHHRQTTRLAAAAGYYQHDNDTQTGWGIKKFVRTTGRYRIVKIRAYNQPAPPPTRYPAISATVSSRSAPMCATNLSQVGFRGELGYDDVSYRAAWFMKLV